jgi:hypothetical protein
MIEEQGEQATRVQDPTTGELIPKDEYRRPSINKSAYIVPDIHGYQSMVTGEWISSRSQHRDHLKRHGLIEIGNEKQVNKPRELDRAGIRRAAEEAVRRVLG